MSQRLLVVAHPAFDDPLAQARAAVALWPAFAGLPIDVALDERCQPDRILMRAYRETPFEGLKRRLRRR